MFGFIPPKDPEADDAARRFPANLALDVIAARRLTELRQSLGLTQSEVARAASRLGLRWTRNTIHAIERFGLGGRPVEGAEGPPPTWPKPTSPQSGTRRLTLMELLVVPKILEEACRARGREFPPIHPMWFLEREALEGVEARLSDPAAVRATWPEVRLRHGAANRPESGA